MSAAEKDSDIAIVRVEPLGVDIDVYPNESLMAAAQRVGLRWPTLCRGNAQCGYCYVEVNADADAPSPSDKEANVLKQAPKAKRSGIMRLACQFQPRSGPVTATRRGVSAAEHSTA